MKTNTLHTQLRRVIFLVVLFCSLPVAARNKFQTYIERGGLTAVTALSGTTAKVQRSCPGATVNVYLIDTTTPATIYKVSDGTPLAFSLTADANGSIEFLGDESEYDLRISGGGCTTHTRRVAVGSGAASVVVDVRTKGAICDGTTDDTVAIQAAIDVSGTHTVQLPSGTCKITDQLLITQHGVTVQGAGYGISLLLYMPTVDNEAAIKADLAAATIIARTTIRNLWIYTTDTTRLKIGIWIVDGSQTLVENVLIGTGGQWRGGTDVSPFTGTGSIGIKLQGREFGTFRNVMSAGAIPLYIDNNPNFPTIDLDLHVFEDLYFLPNGDNPNVYVATGSQLSHILFNNFAWVGGSYGWYQNDTTSAAASYDITFRQGRNEQFTATNHMFWIVYNSAMYNLKFEQVLATGACKGVHLRGIGNAVVFDGFWYNNTLECINADSTVAAIDWRASACAANSTKSLGTLIETSSSNYTVSTSPMPMDGYWITPGTIVNAKKYDRITGGVFPWSGTGTLADAATADITPGGGSLVTGWITISFKGATQNGAITCAINSARTITLATTDAAIAGCTGNVAGDFTLDWGSVNSILIRNNLGESVTYNYLMYWN